MSRAVRFLVAGGLLVMLGGCSDTAPTAPGNEHPDFAAAQVVTDVFVVDIDFTDFAACTSEPVHWTGTAHLVLHEVSNRGAPPPEEEGAQHFTANVSVDLTGVGEISGGTYRLRSSSHNNLQSVSPTEAFPTTFRDTFHERVFGPDGLLGFATFTVKLVLNGTGDLVFDIEEFTEKCL
jgi:hypothetical protein